MRENSSMVALKQSIRRSLPAPVRRLLRAAKLAGGSETLPSPRLRSDLVRDCRFVASRYELVRTLPRGGEVAEVGTDKGLFSRYILKMAKPEKLHLFDLDFSVLVPDVAKDPRVSLHRGPSARTLGGLANASMDWIYIDGDHAYEGVLADALAAAPKVKPGGYLVFNDFAHADRNLGRYGVHRAVTEFANASSWPLVFMAYDPNALYDVALRRPAA